MRSSSCAREESAARVTGRSNKLSKKPRFEAILGLGGVSAVRGEAGTPIAAIKAKSNKPEIHRVFITTFLSYASMKRGRSQAKDNKTGITQEE